MNDTMIYENEKKLQELSRLGIHCVMERNQIILENKNTDYIEKVNEILEKQSELYQNNQYLPLHVGDYLDSYIFVARSNKTFALAISKYLNGKDITPSKTAELAADAFHTYYFKDKNMEYIYFNITYYYRENSAGYFNIKDATYIGDYTIRKQVCISRDADFTTGQRDYVYQQQTRLLPLMI